MTNTASKPDSRNRRFLSDGEYVRFENRSFVGLIEATSMARLRRIVGTVTFVGCIASAIVGGIGHYLIAAVIFTATCFFALLHSKADRDFYSSYVKASNDTGTQVFDCDALLASVAEIAPELTWEQVDVLVNGLLEPAQIRMRTRERITPRTRSFSRQIRIEFDVEPTIGNLLYLPAFTFVKGELQDLREVTSGEGCPARVLTYFESTVRYLSVLRLCVLAAGSKDDTLDPYDEYVQSVERQIVNAVARRSPYAAKASRVQVEHALRQLRQLCPHASVPEFILDAEAVAERLVDRYAVLVQVTPNSDGLLLLDATDSVIPEWPEGQPDRHHTSGGSQRSLSKRPLRSVANLLRTGTGALPARFDVSATLALQSRSYHLEFSGPEGTYLTRQRMRNYSRDRLRALGAYDRWRGRFGQRYAHVYLRGAWNLAEQEGGSDAAPRIQFSFIERPPGSIAVAAVGALACLFLFATVANFPAATESRQMTLAALFLAFPGSVAAWAGLAGDKRLFGALLIARLVNFATLALSMLGAWLMIIPWEHSNQVVWFSAVNAAVACYWWYARSRLYSTFVEKSDIQGDRSSPL